jgi:hypothetical protein
MSREGKAVGEKTCPECGKEFVPRHWRQQYCPGGACRKAKQAVAERLRAARYRAENPERAAEAGRRYRQTHPDKVREWSRRQREKNPEAARQASREANRRYRERDPGRVRERECAWRAENVKGCRQAKALWREKNREHRKEYERRRYAANLEVERKKNREKWRRYAEARRATCPSTIHACEWCGTRFASRRKVQKYCPGGKCLKAAADHRHREAHGEEDLARRQDYRKRHLEELRERNRRYEATHRSKANRRSETFRRRREQEAHAARLLALALQPTGEPT